MGVVVIFFQPGVFCSAAMESVCRCEWRGGKKGGGRMDRDGDDDVKKAGIRVVACGVDGGITPGGGGGMETGI